MDILYKFYLDGKFLSAALKRGWSSLSVSKEVTVLAFVYITHLILFFIVLMTKLSSLTYHLYKWSRIVKTIFYVTLFIFLDIVTSIIHVNVSLWLGSS